jgi:hypothetical protein
VTTTLNNLARLYNKQGKLTKADSLMKRALAIMEKAFGTEQPALTTARENYAIVPRNIDGFEENRSS